jgi:hypothetical protein
VVKMLTPPGRVAAGTGETSDEPELHRIGARVEHDGNCCGRGLGCNGRSFAPHSDDDRDLATDEVRRKRRHPIVLAIRPAIFDLDVATLDEAGLLKAPPKAGVEMRSG